mgnify:CR=1 FL=1
MLLTSTRTPVQLDDGGYFHGTTIRIPLEEGGYYCLSGMQTPHTTLSEEGNELAGRYWSIHSYEEASSCVASMTIFGTGTVFIYWISSDGEETLWDYKLDKLTPDCVLQRFLLTVSLGSVANLVKQDAKSAKIL